VNSTLTKCFLEGELRCLTERDSAMPVKLPLRRHPQEGSDGPLAPIAPERLADPFSQLPAARELFPEEQAVLDEQDALDALNLGSRPISLLTLLLFPRACGVRGPTAERHAKRRRRFAELKVEVERLGFALPSEFVTWMESDEFVQRWRPAGRYLQLPDFVCPCPLDERYVMFLFLVEDQGCDYTHVLLGPDGGLGTLTHGNCVMEPRPQENIPSRWPDETVTHWVARCLSGNVVL
jgi:hypothetical protein